MIVGQGLALEMYLSILHSSDSTAQSVTKGAYIFVLSNLLLENSPTTFH